jgi:nucleoside-diphosphate-sugar epimerase
MKPILVTGATGFIGSYLLRELLQQGHTRIRATRRAGSDMALVKDIEDRVDWMEGDVLDVPFLGEAMQGAGKVYHCAAVVSFQNRDKHRIREVNRTGTANVVNVALDEGIEKLLHVSSIAAIGRRKNTPHIDEQTKWEDDEWNTPYAISKYLAEMEVWRGVAEGLQAVVVNPSNVLGTGFWEGRTGTAQMFSKVKKGLKFYPTGSTGWVDVRDVARFMVKLMDSDVVGERYILSAENLPYRTVLDEIAKSLNVAPPGIEAGPLIRELAWRAAWVLSKFTGNPPLITRQTARASARTFHYDNAKSLGVFKDFSYTPIRQTIAETGREFLVRQSPV